MIVAFFVVVAGILIGINTGVGRGALHRCLVLVFMRGTKGLSQCSLQRAKCQY